MKKEVAERITNDEELNKKPKLVIVMGAVSVGKTMHRKKKYSNGYTHIDAGEIFIQLSEGNYYNFPSHLEEKMNQIGLNKMRESLNNRDNIVIEIIGVNYELVKGLMDLAEKIDYSVVLQFIECDRDIAWQRNINRDNDHISAYFCEQYHTAWFEKSAIEYLNKI